MRIVAGTHRSRKLETLAGSNTRPTSDKIKEAIFSSIGPYFTRGKMLDLFAGSGSMGLEAISRGMDEVYFSDCSKDAIHVIQNNVKLLKEEKHCHLMNVDYMRMLQQVKNMQFMFIFMDPPYALTIHEAILQFIEEHDMLEKNGVIVVETSIDTNLLDRYQSLYKSKEKTYGSSKITYFKKEIQ